MSDDRSRAVSAPTEVSGFPPGVRVIESFAQIADPDLYVPLPDDWLVGIADVVQSTRAIEAGGYKTVNMAGAAVISAVSNAVGHGAFPFVFGGDGAAFAVPPPWADLARTALTATATFVEEVLGLRMRVALVPVATVRRESGLDVRLARFAASPHVSYAMFEGGGLAWLDDEMKGGRFDLPPAPPGARPDLAGLSCRFDAIPAQRGVILSLLVRSGPAADPARYRRVIEDVLRLVDESQEGGRPLPADGPIPTWPAPGVALEVAARRDPDASPAWARLKLLAFTAFSYVILRFRIPVRSFDPNRYLSDLVANSDYRKYDDGLRMTIDCTPAVADALEARLSRASARNEVRYGLHRQASALLTCLTPSPFERDHMHFVDGASGGYAAAAASLKASLA